MKQSLPETKISCRLRQTNSTSSCSSASQKPPYVQINSKSDAILRKNEGDDSIQRGSLKSENIKSAFATFSYVSFEISHVFFFQFAEAHHLE